MDMKEWEIFYNKIMEDFGFDKDKDVESAVILNNILENANTIPVDKLKDIIEGREVFIFGAGPSIKKHINILKELREINYKNPIIVADGACKAFLEENIIPDIIVSDLDGDLEALFECNRKGSIIVVHAHGDNIEKLKSMSQN